MQLYADLRVLTARPSPADMARAPHHLYGVADAAEAWSVGRWLAVTRETLQQVALQGSPAILVGGTGLYFKALTQGLADMPPVPATIRSAAEARYDAEGEVAFRAELSLRDRLAAARIQAGDRQRLVRAMSVSQATGRPLTDWQAASPPTLEEGRFVAAVLEPPRASLYARCDARLQAMAELGGVAEAQALAHRGLSPALPAMKALGVREFLGAAEGRWPLAEAVAQAQLATRHYAKRQLTWFRNQTPHWPRITELEPQARWSALQLLIQRT